MYQSSIRQPLVSLILILITILFLAACAKPYEFQGIVIEEPREVYDATGIDQTGEVYRLSERQGNYVLVNFGYTSCPDICPLTLFEMAQFYNALAEDDSTAADQVDVLFVTVDPVRDTSEQLNKYMAAFHDDFVGLTIEDEESLEVTKNSFAVFSEIADGGDVESGNYLVNHTGGIFVVNREGKWAHFFPHDAKADVILADMVELLKN